MAFPQRLFTNKNLFTISGKLYKGSIITLGIKISFHRLEAETLQNHFNSSLIAEKKIESHIHYVALYLMYDKNGKSAAFRSPSE